MIELRYVERQDPRADPRDNCPEKVLQSRHTYAIRFESGEIIEDGWIDWEDVPTVKENES